MLAPPGSLSLSKCLPLHLFSLPSSLFPFSPHSSPVLHCRNHCALGVGWSRGSASAGAMHPPAGCSGPLAPPPPPPPVSLRGRALPPVRWLFDLYCARVLRAGRIKRTSQTPASGLVPHVLRVFWVWWLLRVAHAPRAGYALCGPQAPPPPRLLAVSLVLQTRCRPDPPPPPPGCFPHQDFPPPSHPFSLTPAHPPVSPPTPTPAQGVNRN